MPRPELRSIPVGTLRRRAGASYQRSSGMLQPLSELYLSLSQPYLGAPVEPLPYRSPALGPDPLNNGLQVRLRGLQSMFSLGRSTDDVADVAHFLFSFCNSVALQQ